MIVHEMDDYVTIFHVRSKAKERVRLKRQCL